MSRKKQQTDPGLKKATLEAIKAGQRLMTLGKSGPLGTGAKRLMSRRLSQLERELRDRRRKPPSRKRLQAIGRETAAIFNELFIALLRYLFLRLWGWNLAP